MKKKGSMLLALLVSALLVFGPSSVLAKEVTLEDGQDLQTVIDAETTEEGDVIVLPEGEYTGNLTLDKVITLKGAGKDKTVIKGQVEVSADVTIQDLTISAKGSHAAGVKVVATADVTISNVVIEYDGYTEGDYGNSDYFRGIWLVKDASDGSTLLVENSEIYAKYGIHLRSARNEVTIKNSEITGYSALDISNAPATQNPGLAESNIVTIEGSTLTGVTAATGEYNHYATIVIGGQRGLELLIDNSTITNTIVTGRENQEDLIRFGAGYVSSESVLIVVTNSELVNTDATHDSAVVNFMTEENTLNTNIIVIEDTTTVTSANDKVIETYGESVLLTFSTIEGDIMMAVEKGFVLDEEEIDSIAIEGYTFGGWYADVNYTTKFNFEEAIEEDTTLYAKFTALATEEEPKEEIKNVDTGDMNLILVITLISVAGIGLAATAKKIFVK